MSPYLPLPPLLLTYCELHCVLLFEFGYLLRFFSSAVENCTNYIRTENRRIYTIRMRTIYALIRQKPVKNNVQEEEVKKKSLEKIRKIKELEKLIKKNPRTFCPHQVKTVANKLCECVCASVCVSSVCVEILCQLRLNGIRC